jgi:hypothetical protein
MSFRDYLHERAEESRHNETTAYLMFLSGTMLFVGGILITLNITSEPNWFLFIPYYAEAHIGAVLALALTFSGFSLLIFGIIAGIHYSHDRGWYMQELHKANSVEDSLLRSKSTTKNSRKKHKAKA